MCIMAQYVFKDNCVCKKEGATVSKQKTLLSKTASITSHKSIYIIANLIHLILLTTGSGVSR